MHKIKVNGIPFKEVPFDVAIKCDGDIMCKSPVLHARNRAGGIDLEKPMMFNQFLEQIGKHFTSMNCSIIFADPETKWYAIDDGVQIEFYMHERRKNGNGWIKT